MLGSYGVLPNYTLLDDAVTLDVGVTWIDPDSNEYMGEQLSYQRGSAGGAHRTRSRGHVLRPGLAVTIDAVDLGHGESNIHAWQVCPQCGWAGIGPSGAATDAGGELSALPQHGHRRRRASTCPSSR